MSETPNKEKPVNDTGGGNAPAPAPGSQPTEPQPTGTPTSQESSD